MGRVRTVGWWLVFAVVVIALRVYPVPASATVAAAGAVAAGYQVLNRRRQASRLRRWARENGWSPAVRESLQWPWQGLVLRGQLRIKRPWVRDVDGIPVTFGEIRWSGGALSGAVPMRAGDGVFVVVRLPLPSPGMAMRMPYQFVGDSHRLERRELRRAFLDGDIPAWTVRGDELFTVEPIPSPTPEAIDRAVQRALLVVRLLDLGAD